MYLLRTGNARLLMNMFNVDLFALVWIAVAMVILGLLVSHFYHGLQGVPSPQRRRVFGPDSGRQTRWLTATLITWWGLDALWHSRAFVVTPQFWRPEVSQALHQGLPWLEWTTNLWRANPILWDFSALAVDSTIAFILIMTWRRPPAWAMWAALGWAASRWTLTGFEASWGQANLIGPGGYFMAAAIAYLIRRPHHYRAVLITLTLWLALDAALTIDLRHLLVPLVLMGGFLVLGYGTLRDWKADSLRGLGLALTLSLVLFSVGRQALYLGMNLLWAPLLLAVVVGWHWTIKSPLTNHE